MSINCPKCQSDQVQSVKVIIEGGTSKSTGQWSGYVAGGGSSGTVGSGYASGTTYNTAKTELAQSLENYIFSGGPKSPGWGIRFFFYLILILFCSVVVYGIVALYLTRKNELLATVAMFAFFVLAIIYWIKGLRNLLKKRKIYSRNLTSFNERTSNAYRKMFYCHKCGNRFLPGEFSEHAILGN